MTQAIYVIFEKIRIHNSMVCFLECIIVSVSLIFCRNTHCKINVIKAFRHACETTDLKRQSFKYYINDINPIMHKLYCFLYVT